ncbi:hypothetical protein EBU71_12830 [bacterium]|nr:hypothetical protein [Candidatus Elulimicrobium humile]
MSKVYIYCDGGFGNRYHSLVSGLFLAKACERDPIVIWPINNYNEASFKDIFETDLLECTDFSGKDWIEKRNPLNIVAWNPWHADVDEQHNCMGIYSPIDSFLKSKQDKDVFFYGGRLCPWVYINALPAIIDTIPFQKSLQDKAQTFIKENFGDENFNGLHVRKTDHPYPLEEDKAIEQINASDIKCFVCSDDPATEKKFIEACPNVRVYPKNSYVEMLIPNGNWGFPVRDSTGHSFPYNVKRGSESVLEAMVDLMILSRSNIINTDHRSTFIRTAILISKDDLRKRYSN